MAQPEPERMNGAIYERTAILVQQAGLLRLAKAHVLLAGVGGVGGHCAEALVRAGIGAITLVDHDVVSATNKNRQLIALDSNIGQSKVEELAKRLADINAQCIVTSRDAFILPEDAELLLRAGDYTHVVDAIDSVECKVALLEASVKLGLPVFSSGGAGGRLDATLVKEGDLFETENDALSRTCRTELRKRGIGWGYVRVVYSTEKARPPLAPVRQESGGRDRGINGTISYMPPLFGLHLASMAIRHALDPEAEANQARARKKRQTKLDRDSAAAARAKERSDGAKASGKPTGKKHRPEQGSVVDGPPSSKT